MTRTGHFSHMTIETLEVLLLLQPPQKSALAFDGSWTYVGMLGDCEYWVCNQYPEWANRRDVTGKFWWVEHDDPHANEARARFKLLSER